jgi:heme-degrading monooxygenase HmoA
MSTGRLVSRTRRHTAATDGGGTVIGVNVTFGYAGDFDRDRVLKVASNARGMFEGMPGLRFKFFTLDEEQQRAVNFYVWDSKEAADGFFTEQLRERVTGLYGVAPVIDFVEIAEIVDNSVL